MFKFLHPKTLPATASPHIGVFQNKHLVEDFVSEIQHRPIDVEIRHGVHHNTFGNNNVLVLGLGQVKGIL